MQHTWLPGLLGLSPLTRAWLTGACKERGIKRYSRMNRGEMVEALLIWETYDLPVLEAIQMLRADDIHYNSCDAMFNGDHRAGCDCYAQHDLETLIQAVTSKLNRST